MMFRILLTLIGFVIVGKTCFAQLSNFTYPLEQSEGVINITQLYNLLPKDAGKNIFLLSETNHTHKKVDYARQQLLKEIVTQKNVDKIYYENTWEHDTLLKKYLDGDLHIEEYKESMKSKYLPYKIIRPDSVIFPYYDQLTVEIDSLAKDNFLDMVTRARSENYSDKLQPIDIGTQTMWLGLFHLMKITKAVTENLFVNQFLDSMRVYCRAEYYKVSYATTDNQKEFEHNKSNIERFLLELRTNTGDSVLVNRWQSIFARYYMFNAHREISLPDFMGGKPNTAKQFLKRNSYRDSVMYENFKFYLPKDWQNLVFIFSTAHLMDSRNTEYFKEVLDDNTRLIGRDLHKDYEPYLRRIAFVCFEGLRKNKLYNNKYAKNSLEYMLSLNHEYAYVDLKSYRESSFNRKPFYMRPTFWKYRKLNWENIFDGIVFLRECNCEKE